MTGKSKNSGPRKDAALLASSALLEALGYLGSEEASWQPGSGGARDKTRSMDRAAIPRGLTTAPGVTTRGAA